MNIALCGVNEKIVRALEQHDQYHILNFCDEAERHGDMKLVYFLRDG